ncbi:MAG: hypothetical protein WCK97_04430 [Actinomycetes bacterium]|jgi:hypothetical protein
MPEQPIEIKVSSPAASEVETAAVVAALRRFLDDNAPSAAVAEPRQPAWLVAALSEGVQRQPQLPPLWAAGGA